MRPLSLEVPLEAFVTDGGALVISYGRLIRDANEGGILGVSDANSHRRHSD